MKHKDIPGYEGLYRLYEDGRVWSYRAKRFLTVGIDRDGYRRFTVCVNHKVKNQALHRWLYITFVGNIEEGKQINHKDGNKLNNALSNLELVTPKENTNHAWGIGLARKRFGSETSMAKLTENDIPKIIKMYNDGFKQGEIAEMFGIDQSNISRIVSKNTWTHVQK